MFRERIFIGEGWEHRAYLGPVHKNYVFKETKKRQNTYLHIAGFFEGKNPVELIRQDVQKAQEMVDNTHFIVAKTRIFKLPRGSYIVTQPFIEEDYSIPNIDAFVNNHASRFLREKFYIQRQNFITNDGKIYWIDPTKGILTRFLTDTHVLSWEQLTTIKYNFLKTASRFRKFGVLI